MLDDIRTGMSATRRSVGKSQLDDRVMAAIADVPRDEFVPEHLRNAAFADGPLPIGHGQTISQPYIVALMTDLIEPRPSHRVLEIGTGSGYQTAVLARLCETVYSVESIPALSETAAERLRRLGYTNAVLRCGNGYLGWPEHAPYDGIVVTAAAPFVPQALMDQLKPGGRMAIPVGAPYEAQSLRLIEKTQEGEIVTRDVLAVAFVPLVDGGPDLTSTATSPDPSR
jgi:protein-L-isoaspartate(D-aspartate) O-methyltransferase